MKLGKFLNTIGDLVLEVAVVGVTATAGQVMIGRALSSTVAYRLDQLPIIGPAIIGLRRNWHQTYDPVGEGPV